MSLDNLSASEQLKFALNIVRKLNETFKVICIDGIETLDKDNFVTFLKEIEGDDYQYFVTRVDGDVKGGIVIEDGAIKK
jgi:disulfide oxidoreductase YuzD